MAVDPAFRLHVRTQLGQLVSVTDRAMFGGVGVYADGIIFAVIDNDTLYLKGDDQTRELFLAAGSFPFTPFGEGGPMMSYYAIPNAVIDDTAMLRPWVDRAIEAAKRAKQPKKRKA